MARCEDVFVLVDGGLGSLVACTSARIGPASSGCLRAWGPASIRPKWTELLSQFAGDWVTNTDLTESESGEAANLSITLFSAALTAAKHGAGRVVWPVHSGVVGKPDEMDLDSASCNIDRAILVTRLVSVDAVQHGCASISIETPYADFSDRQLAELALDMGVPFRKAPWWGDGSSSEFARWQRVFDAIGSVAAG